MYTAFKLMAMTAVASAVDLMSLERPLTQVQAGAMDLYLNATSIQNLMQIFVPITAATAINNQTFKVGYKASSIFYTLDIESVYVDHMDFTGDKIFEIEPNTNIVHVKFTGVNVATLVTGSMKLIHLIPMDASGVDVNGLTVDVTLEPINAADGVHWALKDTTFFHMDSMAIKMKNSFLQELVKLSQSLITKMVNAELPNLGKIIQKQVDKLNAALKAEETSPLAFAVPLFDNAALNLTMTASPDLSTQGLIKVYFNGLILENGKARESIGGIPVPPRIEHFLSEQFWFHQSMLNSLMQVADDHIFPLDITSPGITAQLKQVFPELVAHYGKDMTLKLIVRAETKSEWLTIDSKQGFKIGGQDVIFTFDLMCSNAQIKEELAASIAMNVNAVTQTNIYAFNVFPMIGDVSVTGAYVVKDNIGMYSHDYNALFTSVLQNAATDINTQYNTDGWSLANIDPTIGMLAGLLQQFTVSPMKSDQFLMLGWSMYADMPTLADYRGEHMLGDAPVEGATILSFTEPEFI